MVDTILVTALERLSVAGDDDDDDEVSVHDVAARAGVGIGSLYDYFRDRGSLLSAAAAKLAQDNLDAFHALLEQTHALPLRQAVENVIDFAIDTYTRDPRKMRVVVRLTTRLGLLPTLARSQTLFAASMANALRKRSDVHVPDLDIAAWVLTQSMMGVAMTLIWTDPSDNPPARQKARDAFVDMTVTYLSGATATGATPPGATPPGGTAPATPNPSALSS